MTIGAFSSANFAESSLHLPGSSTIQSFSFRRLSENHSKSAHVRAICDCAWTHRTFPIALFAGIKPKLSARDFAMFFPRRARNRFLPQPDARTADAMSPPRARLACLRQSVQSKVTSHTFIWTVHEDEFSASLLLLPPPNTVAFWLDRLSRISRVARRASVLSRSETSLPICALMVAHTHEAETVDWPILASG